MSWIFRNLYVLSFVSIVGCASSEPVNPKVHPAVYATEAFQVEQGMPIREVKQHDFYFKRCELETRHPFTSKAEYSCNDH